MRIAKEATVGSMKKLSQNLTRCFPLGKSIEIVLRVRNYTQDPTEFGLYAPGIASFDWRYFDTWEKLVQFCFQLIAEKEEEKKQQSGLQPKR